MHKMLGGVVLAMALGAASVALAQSPQTVAETAKGAALVDSKGMTLYVFDRDSGGKSACNGPCAVNWPPFMAAAGATGPDGWTVIVRDDGKSQWAYRGKPLYGWAKDQKPGDVTGDGVNGVWHIAKP